MKPALSAAALSAIAALVAVFLLVSLPPLGPLTGPAPALADDDGGGDDGGDDGGGGRGGGGGGGRGGGGGYVGAPRGGNLFDLFRNSRDRGGAQRRVRPPAQFLPDEIVVAGVTAQVIDDLVREGFTLVERAVFAPAGGEIARLREPPRLNYESARARILALAPGAVVDRNHLYRTSELACPKTGCAGARLIAWPSDNCGATPLIGMIDTDVNLDHQALAGRALEEISVLGPGRKSADAAHGTAIAALLIGEPGSRTPGLVPEARVIAVTAFHDHAGTETADAFALARALDLLIARKVHVANLSFAGPPNNLLELAVRAALDADIAIVAAAGNGGAGAAPAYPAAYPDVVAVTAVGADRKVYRQAGRGGHLDFAAPGVKLWTAASQSGGRFRSGTSYAAPFVTAALAVRRAHSPEQPLPQIVDEMAARAHDLGETGRDPLYGWGLIQASELCTLDPRPTVRTPAAH